MIDAFNQIYKAFQGFLSQSFWYTVFVPVALFAAIHAAILTQFGWRPDLEDLLNDNGKAAKSLLVVVATLVVVGYVLQSFLPMLRGLLDGSLLPKWLHDQLRKERLPEVFSTRDAIGKALQILGEIDGLREDARRPNGAFGSARSEGNALGAANDAPAVVTAEESIRVLNDTLTKGGGAKLNLIDQAQSDLVAALRANSSSIMPPAQGADLSRRLRQVDNRFRDLLLLARNEAKYEFQIEQNRLRVSRALDVPRATLLGDARYAVESYAKDVYNVDFDFLWPRLLIMLRAEAKDDAFLAAVDAARDRVDFGALCLLLVFTVPLVWLPAVFVKSGPIWLIPALGGTMPLALATFYQMVVEGQLAFGEAIKTTIDRHRFLVFKMLHQGTPATRAEERSRWRRVQQAEEDGRISDLVYAPDKPGA
jgi:hypothetical protein